MAEQEEPIFTYLRLLHANGGKSSPKAKKYKKLHLTDPKNAVLARGAEKLFEHRDEILEELDKIEKRKKMK